METLLRDLRYALRMLLVRPAITVAAIISIGLGIGANTAIFSVINALLLKSLPYPNADKLVLVWGKHTGAQPSSRSQVSATDVADYRSQNAAFEDITTYGSFSGTFTGSGEPEWVDGEQVGDGYFQIMGGNPLLGRVFSPDDQIDGKDFVMVLSFGLWQRRFGGDPAVIGQTVGVSGKPYTIVGVMPASFRPLPASLVDRYAQFYRPVAEKYSDPDRSSRHLRAIARLKPGVTVSQAGVEMAAISARLEAAHPLTNSNYSATVRTLAEDTVGGLRPTILVLQGAVLFVLLIACANVANLLLMRAMARQQEIAVRSALGAGRLRLIRQLLAESVLLGVAGGVLGLALALEGVHLIVAIGSRSMPILSGITLDGGVLVFTLALSLVTGFIFGLAPAIGASRFELAGALKEGGRGSGAGIVGGYLRRALVISEVAMSLVLLAGAGLLIKTVSGLRDLDGGFTTNNLLTTYISLPSARYTQENAKAAFYKQLVDRIETLPGVESAGFVSVLPLGSDFDGRGLAIEDHPRPSGDEMSADMYVVTPSYLHAMGIRLLKGRMLTERDDHSSPLAALINERFANDFWEGKDPIGKRIRFPGTPDKPGEWRTIVGVVGNVDQYGPDKEPPDQFYLPEAQYPMSGGSLVIRTKAQPKLFAAAVTGQVHAMDKDLALYNVSTMDELLSDSISLRNFSMLTLGVFALVALTLAALGTYSTVSYSVSRQTREIGIRIALGAGRVQVLRFVLRQGMMPSIIGLVCGTVAAIVLTRFMSAMLYGVTPTDPGTFAATVALLAAAAVLACYIPARRASRTDAMTALRYE